jgi:hypothetical protein
MTLPSFDHLLSISNDIGTFEHADHTNARHSHGYCTDDVARVLIVVSREPSPADAVRELGRTSFQFVADAQSPDGRVRNRRTASGAWHGEPGVDDCWGRSVWALGTAVRHAPDGSTRRRALAAFDRGVKRRSPSPRSMAFASLGAAEVLSADSQHARALDLLRDSVTSIGPVATAADWPWPEPRLAYANAALPETLIAAGHFLERPDITDDGLTLLRWLLDRETVDGHLSPTPVGGAGPGDRAPSFDQQPIEVAAMADACVRAAAVTGDDSWQQGIEMAIRWFEGDNDAAALMWDPETGGGYDGLHARGANLNQGAESTLALISTLQHARLFSSAS